MTASVDLWQGVRLECETHAYTDSSAEKGWNGGGGIYISLNNGTTVQQAIPAGRHRLAGPVVKASALRAEDPAFESRLRRDFSGVDRVIPVT